MIQFIDDHKDEFGVESVCRHLPIAPQTYYAAKGRPPSKRSITDEAVTVRVHEIHVSHYGVSGVRKVHAELLREGRQVVRCTVERLMKKEGLRGIRRAKGPRTTILGPLADRPADLVKRRFAATAPDGLWVADITYIRTSWIPAIVATLAARSRNASLLPLMGSTTRRMLPPRCCGPSQRFLQSCSSGDDGRSHPSSGGFWRGGG